MVPYIAILIVLIVAVLFAVYKRVDTFEIGPFRVAQNTTLGALIKKANEYIALNQTMKSKLETLSPSELLTKDTAKELGITFTTGTPVVTALRESIDLQLGMVRPGVIELQKSIRAGEFKETMTVKDAILKKNPKGKMADIPFQQINDFVSLNIRFANAREKYINTKSKANKQNTNKPITGNDIFGGVKQAIKASTLENTNPVPPQASSISVKEMEERIAKKLAKSLKDSTLAQRSTENVYGSMPCPLMDSNAVSQGQEFRQAKPSSQPDMSEYIRKDSIPCWNCSLP